MTPEEALIALEAGASAIVVSNHGGRITEHAPATAEVLPAIADKVKHRIVIMVDGGVRSGGDVLKMLALGADVVHIGRPIVQMAVGGGTEGVKLYMEQLINDLRMQMILTGVSKVDEITRDILLV